MYRLALALAAILCLTACTGTAIPVVVTPVMAQTTTLDGNATIGSLTIGGFPWTYPIRAWGQGTITLQYPGPPYIVITGEIGYEIVVEPVSESDRPAIDAALARGDLVILSNGRRAGLALPRVPSTK